MARGSSKSPEKAMKKQVKMEESDEMERDEDEERMQVEGLQAYELLLTYHRHCQSLKKEREK